MDRCSLCSRDFPRKDVRNSRNGYLCQACWAVISPQPWPEDDSAHGGLYGSHFANGGGGTRPNGHAAMTAKAAAQEAADAANAAHHATMHQRRSQSVANLAGMAVPTNQRRAHPHTLPHSMPEHPGILSGSADSYRIGGLGGHQVAASAPAWKTGALAVPAAPPTFSPLELRNMMHEESLELFESQSHLLDPESRATLQRQRQYLEWQNSVEEPGPMQSVLERQDSAGSGCNDDDLQQGMGAHHSCFAPAATRGGGDGNGGTFDILVNDGSAGALSVDTDSGGNGALSLRHDLQESRRHLAVVSREREALTTRVQQLEAELQAQREATLCKICHRSSRNCVVLPCLHFTSCDSCFKKHCASTLCCPSCNSRVTGFQTLLVL